jgi:hypothetical protein
MTIFGRPAVLYAPALALWLVSLGYLAMAAGYPADARAMPMLIGGLMAVLVPLDLISISDTPGGRTLRRALNPSKRSAQEEAEEAAGLGRQAGALGCILAFAAALVLIGVVAAIPLYVVGSMWLFGRRPLVSSLVTGGLVGLSCWLLFDLALGIDLFPGLLFA